MADGGADGRRRVDEATRESLVGACQRNGWLMRGGYAWQDDPFMEEYPYEFVRFETAEALRSYFAEGNHAIREGALYGDLAFVQQVNGGDEWWTLKRDGGGWAEFESVSFGAIARRDAGEFAELVGAMRDASVGECRSLSYLDREPRRGLVVRAESARELSALLGAGSDGRDGARGR